VLRSGDVLGRFGELTEIMGGDEERARKIVEQRPDVLLYIQISAGSSTS
jgi:hypothetical protein